MLVLRSLGLNFLRKKLRRKISVATLLSSQLKHYDLVFSRDDHGAGVPKWTPAGVWILGWSRSRSQYFRFEPEQEPESRLRSVQKPITLLRDLLKFMYWCLLLSNWMKLIETWFLTTVVIYPKLCDTGWEYRAVLSLLGILSLDWNFWPFQGFFRDFRKSMKMSKMNYLSLFCKSYFVVFLTFIMALRFYAALPQI